MWEAVHRTLAGYVVAAPGCTAPAGTTSSQKPVGAKEAEAGKRGDESTMKSTKRKQAFGFVIGDVCAEPRKMTIGQKTIRSQVSTLCECSAAPEQYVKALKLHWRGKASEQRWHWLAVGALHFQVECLGLLRQTLK